MKAGMMIIALIADAVHVTVIGKQNNQKEVADGGTERIS